MVLEVLEMSSIAKSISIFCAVSLTNVIHYRGHRRTESILLSHKIKPRAVPMRYLNNDLA